MIPYLLLDVGDIMEPGDEVVSVRDFVGCYWRPVDEAYLHGPCPGGWMVRRPLRAQPSKCVVATITETTTGTWTVREPGSTWTALSASGARAELEQHYPDVTFEQRFVEQWVGVLRTARCTNGDAL